MVDLSYDEEEMVAELMSKYGDNILQRTNAVYAGLKLK
jgi:hypothetical protein